MKHTPLRRKKISFIKHIMNPKTEKTVMVKISLLTRKPIRRRAKKEAVKTPIEVYRQVCVRSGGEWIDGKCVGGRCENPDCPQPQGDFRGLQFAHVKNRSMGGTRDPMIHSIENVKRLCAYCHNVGLHHLKEIV